MIYNYAADTVTVDNLRDFFSGGKWAIDNRGDTIVAESAWGAKLMFTPGMTKYEVEIRDLEDPSDKEELITKDPIEAIKKFLTKGMPEAESLLTKAASSPSTYSVFLKKLAASIESSTNISRSKTRRLIRRASILPLLRIARGGASNELDKILNQMEENGWDAKKKGDGPLDPIVVNIGGIFEATILVDSIEWEYDFSIMGTDTGNASGTTDDPLNTFRYWRRDQSTQDAIKEREEEEKARKEAIADEPTVAPGKR